MLWNRLKDNKLLVKDVEAGREAETETYVGQVEARDRAVMDSFLAFELRPSST